MHRKSAVLGTVLFKIIPVARQNDKTRLRLKLLLYWTTIFEYYVRGRVNLSGRNMLTVNRYDKFKSKGNISGQHRTEQKLDSGYSAFTKITIEHFLELSEISVGKKTFKR